MKFNKNQLDQLGTLLGAVVGITTVLTTQQIISPKIGGTIGGIASVLLGIVIQRPATGTPTTEDIEEGATK